MFNKINKCGNCLIKIIRNQHSYLVIEKFPVTHLYNSLNTNKTYVLNPRTLKLVKTNFIWKQESIQRLIF